MALKYFQTSHSFQYLLSFLGSVRMIEYYARLIFFLTYFLHPLLKNACLSALHKFYQMFFHPEEWTITKQLVCVPYIIHILTHIFVIKIILIKFFDHLQHSQVLSGKHWHFFLQKLKKLVY